MSINIKIELPAATVLAIQEGLVQDAVKGGDARALRVVRAVRALTDHALLDAVKALPYDLTPKAAAPEPAPKPNQLKRSTSLDSDTSTEAPRPKMQRKTSTSFQIFLKLLSGKTITLEVTNQTTFDDIKMKVEEREHIPPESQRLIFAGREMRGRRTLGDEKIMKESTLHHVLKLCGS